MGTDLEDKEISAEQLIDLHKKHLWLHLTNHKLFAEQEPPIMAEGKGYLLKDVRGREYLDGLSGGVWAVNVGYGRDSIVDAVAKQLRQLPYYAGSMATPPAILLAQKLAALLPQLGKTYISNSGSEANEKSFKIARQYSQKKYPGKDKYKIIYRNRDYHGTTLAALASSGQTERKTGFGPLPTGFVEFSHALCYRCQFGKKYPGCNLECAHALATVIARAGEDSVAAVIVEPVTAGGGIIVPVAEYYQVLQAICQQHGVLLIMDEVVTGFGRTGKMFGHQHYQADPDIVTLAKGLASGYMPISATVVRANIYEQFVVELEDQQGYFRDISTFGGCAGASAAALENIKIIQAENLVENSVKMGNCLLAGLQELNKLPVVGEVRGKGLLVGIELVADKKTKSPLAEKYLAKVVADAKAEGVLIGRMVRSVPTLNNVLYVAPPLIIDQEGVDRIISALSIALTNLKV